MTDDKKSDDITKLIILALGLATAMYFAYLVLKESNKATNTKQPQSLTLHSTYPNQEYIKIQEQIENINNKVDNFLSSQPQLKQIETLNSKIDNLFSSQSQNEHIINNKIPLMTIHEMDNKEENRRRQQIFGMK